MDTKESNNNNKKNGGRNLKKKTRFGAFFSFLVLKEFPLAKENETTFLFLTKKTYLTYEKILLFVAFDPDFI